MSVESDSPLATPRKAQPFSYFKQSIYKGIFAKLGKLAVEEYNQLVG